MTTDAQSDAQDDTMDLKECQQMAEEVLGVKDLIGPQSLLLPDVSNDTRIFNAKRLCPDGCPPCKSCGIHIDSWWYFMRGGYCDKCNAEKEPVH